MAVIGVVDDASRETTVCFIRDEDVPRLDALKLEQPFRGQPVTSIMIQQIRACVEQLGVQIYNEDPDLEKA
jgi:hypothetical protein